jgi:hypothetical protein
VTEGVADKLLDIKSISIKDQVLDDFNKALAVKDLDKIERTNNLSRGLDLGGLLNNVAHGYNTSIELPDIVPLKIHHRDGLFPRLY